MRVCAIFVLCIIQPRIIWSSYIDTCAFQINTSGQCRDPGGGNAGVVGENEGTGGAVGHGGSSAVEEHHSVAGVCDNTL